MIFTETRLKGAFIIEPELIKDERGFFARAFCRNEFISKGLNPDMVQCNISLNHKKGTLRGMHYQVQPYSEIKLVRCTSGSVYDVIIDFRPDSKTFKQWVGTELSASNHKMFYVPEGFAHGYQTLEDNTEVFYQVSSFYHPEAESGLRWNDPAFGIKWPIPVTTVSTKDASHPDWKAE